MFICRECHKDIDCSKLECMNPAIMSFSWRTCEMCGEERCCLDCKHNADILWKKSPSGYFSIGWSWLDG